MNKDLAATSSSLNMPESASSKSRKPDMKDKRMSVMEPVNSSKLLDARQTSQKKLKV